MKRIVLFSTPTDKNLNEILTSIFPRELKNKVFAYMPSDGANCLVKYRNIWRTYAEEKEAEFIYIDNSKVGGRSPKRKREISYGKYFNHFWWKYISPNAESSTIRA